MVDELGHLLHNVSLDTFEEDVAVHDDNHSKGNIGQSDFTLIERMVMKKPINLEAAMKSTLSRVWQISDALEVQEICDLKWVFQFGLKRNMSKVLLRQPWW